MADLITFPPGVLGTEPVRLPVVARGDGWFAVAKPAGMVLAPDPLQPEGAPALVGAIHAAAVAGKPQLAALGIAGCARIHDLDAEESGAALLASTEDASARLRDAHGSGFLEFVHEFVAEASDGPDALECDLPLVRDEARPRLVVSHRAGRRCRTSFTLVRRLGRHALWEARTAGNRGHQVRLHAAESGLRIVGESLYARVRPVFLSSLKRGYRPGHDGERPLHPGLALHLRTIRGTAGAAAGISVEVPLPRSLTALIRRLEQAAR